MELQFLSMTKKENAQFSSQEIQKTVGVGERERERERKESERERVNTNIKSRNKMEAIRLTLPCFQNTFICKGVP
jgi:hypothetical protein